MQIDESAEEQNNLKKLLAHRIELWGINEIAAKSVIKASGGVEPRVALAVGTVDGFIACNRQVSDDVMNRLDGAARDMVKEGMFRMLGL
jgi:polar amino acid transport system substrate-binding protein